MNDIEKTLEGIMFQIHEVHDQLNKDVDLCRTGLAFLKTARRGLDISKKEVQSGHCNHDEKELYETAELYYDGVLNNFVERYG